MDNSDTNWSRRQQKEHTIAANIEDQPFESRGNTKKERDGK